MPSTAPSTPIRDNFNRADGPLGANWNGPAIHTNNLTISTNRFTNVNAVAVANAFWIPNGPAPAVSAGYAVECYFQMLQVGPASHSLTAILVDNPVGTLAATKGYAVVVWNVMISSYRIDPGGSFLLQNLPATINPGDWLWMIYRPGGALEAWTSANGTTWTLQSTNTDATYQNVPLYFGCQADDNTVFGDNFGGGSLTPAGTVTAGAVRNQYKQAQSSGIDMRTMQRATHASVANGVSAGGAAEGTLTQTGSPSGVLGTGANADLYTPAAEAV